MRKRASDAFPHEHVVDDERLEVGLRRAPRIGRFLTLGVVAGVIAALIATIGAEASGTGAAIFGFEGFFRFFVVSGLVFVAIGLTISGLLIIAFERHANRRAGRATGRRAVMLYHDLSRPANDEPPRRDH